LPVPPDLATSPSVLAVGDIHLENFGTWRDDDGRLVWGVNDFDEAAEMPYVLDLVRLATSALLARSSQDVDGNDVCAAILQGYAKGVDAPRPFVLDEEYAWLRKLVVVGEEERGHFWKKIDEMSPSTEGPAVAIAGNCGCDAGASIGAKFISEQRHRQPGSAALGGRRKLAGRPGGARGKGPGDVRLDPHLWARLAKLAMQGDRLRPLSSTRPMVPSRE
jgi:hypothetical protein